jgi:putative nucleotidyltransferase with HDIG domain
MRVFFFGSVPMCIVLAGGFLLIHSAIKRKVTEGLKTSLSVAERALDRTNADYEERAGRLLSVLSENAGLKAGFGLLREARRTPEERQQVRATIEEQLEELSQKTRYDLLVAADPQGRPVAGIIRTNGETASIDLDLPLPATGTLAPVGGEIYENRILPVNLGEESLGSLIVGRRFDLTPWNYFGYATLFHGEEIVLSSIPPAELSAAESGLEGECESDSGCEIEIGGETYLALPVHYAGFGDGFAHTQGSSYRLFSFQSIDRAMSGFTGGFAEVFLLIGFGGILAILLVSAVGSRLVSKPITALLERLKKIEQTGTLRPEFPNDSPVTEVAELAQGLNRAAEAVSDSQLKLDEATLEFVETMARALDARDAYTAGHSDRVSANSTAVARAMGLSDGEVEVVRIGAKLHDIGKIGVPDAILQKPGKLTVEEFEIVKEHPQIGRRILEKVGSFQKYLPIVELHHEDYNGKGYPHGLRGEDLPLGVRIVHVADVYDAITSNRSYRKAMPEEQVREIMEGGAGTQFDPEVVRVFLAVEQERRVLDTLLEDISSTMERPRSLLGESFQCVAAAS